MTSSDGKYMVPDELESDLARVQAYWDGLKRGESNIPFADDVRFSSHARLAREVMLLEVFESPLRFRFDVVGDIVSDRYGTGVTGKFTDEVGLRAPIDELTQQCRATVERRAPTYFRHAQKKAADAPPLASPGGYSRLVLPLWGNGRIEMLIAAVHLD